MTSPLRLYFTIQMSATFCYEVINPTGAKRFAHGTSSDERPLAGIFDGVVSTNDLDKLRAMHLATHLSDSLWSDIAEVLERLQGDSIEEFSIKVWAEY